LQGSSVRTERTVRFEPNVRSERVRYFSVRETNVQAFKRAWTPETLKPLGRYLRGPWLKPCQIAITRSAETERPQHATEGNNRSVVSVHLRACPCNDSRTCSHFCPRSLGMINSKKSPFCYNYWRKMRSEARTVGLEVTDLFIIGGCVEPTKQQPISNVNWNSHVSHRPIQRNERVPYAYVIFWAERTFGTRTVK